MLTIDFEASCLPRDGRSFPIEVGIADPSGWTRSWLIRPEPVWSDWTWTDEAQALHGIARERLAAEGRPAAAVMAELNAAVAGRCVIADHDCDRRWLALLSAASGVASGFGIEHVSQLLDRHRPTKRAVEQAMAIANRRVPARHRAGPDALWLATVVAHIRPDACAKPMFDWDRQESHRAAA